MRDTQIRVPFIQGLPKHTCGLTEILAIRGFIAVSFYQNPEEGLQS